MTPLHDLTILDLTHMLSGPYASQLLADMGARCIKIEPPKGGEGTRKLLADDPQYSIDGMGAYFLTLSRNKQSVCLNLKEKQGLELFYELVKHADIVINNFGEGVPKRLGIDFDTLKQHNPRIITCSITGFGETGPERNRPAFDLVAQGMGGGMSITGEENGPPLRAGIPIGDLGGGLFATIGILSALHARTLTGKGQHVDISMQDCQVSLLNYMATMYLMSGVQPPAVGNGHFVHVPYGTFRTQSRYIILACMGDAFFIKLAQMLKDPFLLEERFHKQPERWAHRHAINAKVQEYLEQNTCEYWLEQLKEHRIPAAPVNDFSYALKDPQIQARNMVVEVPLPNGRTVPQPGNPVKLSETDEQPMTPPPTLGQHTQSVLTELLGLPADRLAALQQAGIIN
ncbi:MAG: CaiB/BaiF CoA-transferase family protein [Gammaproteobacteria bacterium]